MSSRQKSGELIVNLLKALEEIDPGDKDSIEPVLAYLYIPDPKMCNHLDRLKTYTKVNSPSKQQRADAGNLLEQISVLAFNGLKGITSIKSFRSAGPQYDLLVSGDSIAWFHLAKLLYMQENKRDIVLEAKCTKGKISDQIFSRLCSLMEINLFSCVGLGIFFTLNGATGFPSKEDPRQRKIGDARLRQALFHAKTGKAIVVFDQQDIFELDKPASLVKMLIRKVRDIEHLSGLPIESPDLPKEIDLPNHLEMVVNR